MDFWIAQPDANGRFPLSHLRAQAPEGADPQVLTSWALARAFGHGWARCGQPAHAAPPAWADGERSEWPAAVPMTWTAAQAAYDEAVKTADPDGWNGGDVGLSPHHKHVTASNRISWVVATNGDVTAEIRRPSGAICGLRPDGTIWRAKPNAPTGAPSGRHLAALAWVLSALGHTKATHYRQLADRRIAAERAAVGAAPEGYDPRWDEARQAPDVVADA